MNTQVSNAGYKFVILRGHPETDGMILKTPETTHKVLVSQAKYEGKIDWFDDASIAWNESLSAADHRYLVFLETDDREYDEWAEKGLVIFRFSHIEAE